MRLGFKVAIETSNGVVGLYTSQLGNIFKVFYPLNANVYDEIVNEIFNIKLNPPNSSKCKLDKHLYGKYYLEKLSDNSNLCIGVEDQHIYCHNLFTIDGIGLKEHYCGHMNTNTIFLYNLTDDLKVSNSEILDVEEYRKKFIKLLTRIVQRVGKIVAVNIQCGWTFYTPELLKKDGYFLEEWEKHGVKYCYTRKSNYEIMLKKTNDLLSWSTIVRYKCNYIKNV